MYIMLCLYNYTTFFRLYHIFATQYVDICKYHYVHYKYLLQVLLRAVQAFEAECINLLGISPFHHAMTTAQLAATIYRSKFMENGLFGRVPPNNYASVHNNSRIV